MPALTAGQCRAAREALGWTAGDLAVASQVPKRIVLDFERHHRVPEAEFLLALRGALEAAGSSFP